MIPLRPGERIGNYVLQELRGRGSFAEVWRARHHALGELAAVKIPTDPQYVRNLQREGLAIHSLRHPNIVQALDLDPYSDPPYLVMEYVPGPNLQELLEIHPQGLAVCVAGNILQGVLQALDAAHARGLIHRDLKPANILLGIGPGCLADLAPRDVKVTDFGLGLSRVLTGESIQQSACRPNVQGTLSGTIAYMAPEQRDGQDVDQRCDLFACGMLLFEMLTGRRPQGRDLPSELRPGIPSRLDEIFERCHTRLERRYKSAEEVLRDLVPISGQQDQEQPPGRCPACQAEPEPQDRFCIHCGQPLLANAPSCPRCAAVARPDDSFCIMCGADLQAPAAAAERHYL